MKSIIYEFDPVIYPFPLLISKNFDIDEVKDRFYLMINRTDVEELTTQLNKEPAKVATTYMFVEKKTSKIYHVVLFHQPKLVRQKTLTHEAFHVNTNNSWILGINNPDPGVDEPQAYFTGWVAKCIESVIKNTQNSMNVKLFE